jgi:preprotein translocase subunit YajC
MLIEAFFYFFEQFCKLRILFFLTLVKIHNSFRWPGNLTFITALKKGTVIKFWRGNIFLFHMILFFCYFFILDFLSLKSVSKIQTIMNAIQKGYAETAIAGLAVILTITGSKSTLWRFARATDFFQVYGTFLPEKLRVYLSFCS